MHKSIIIHQIKIQTIKASNKKLKFRINDYLMIKDYNNKKIFIIINKMKV